VNTLGNIRITFEVNLKGKKKNFKRTQGRRKFEFFDELGKDL
jgi:hypothetical protein